MLKCNVLYYNFLSQERLGIVFLSFSTIIWIHVNLVNLVLKHYVVCASVRLLALKKNGEKCERSCIFHMGRTPCSTLDGLLKIYDANSD